MYGGVLGWLDRLPTGVTVTAGGGRAGRVTEGWARDEAGGGGVLGGGGPAARVKFVPDHAGRADGRDSCCLWQELAPTHTFLFRGRRQRPALHPVSPKAFEVPITCPSASSACTSKR